MAEQKVIITRKSNGVSDSLYPRTVAEMVKYSNGDKNTTVKDELADIDATLINIQDRLSNDSQTGVEDKISDLVEANSILNTNLTDQKKDLAVIEDDITTIKSAIDEINSYDPEYMSSFIDVEKVYIASIPNIDATATANTTAISEITERVTQLESKISSSTDGLASEDDLASAATNASAAMKRVVAVEADLETFENETNSSLENFESRIGNLETSINDADSGIITQISAINDALTSINDNMSTSGSSSTSSGESLSESSSSVIQCETRLLGADEPGVSFTAELSEYYTEYQYVNAHYANIPRFIFDSNTQYGYAYLESRIEDITESDTDEETSDETSDETDTNEGSSVVPVYGNDMTLILINSICSSLEIGSEAKIILGCDKSHTSIDDGGNRKTYVSGYTNGYAALPILSGTDGSGTFFITIIKFDEYNTYITARPIASPSNIYTKIVTYLEGYDDIGIHKVYKNGDTETATSTSWG